MSTETYDNTYSLDNAAQGERDRLALVERAWDPNSTRHFEQIGVREGSHVLMIAGGGGSLVEWICQRVGPTGRVLATDLDPRFLLPLTERYEQLEVRQHNVVLEDLPEGEFDYAHTRLLVAWLPDRELVIRKMAAALKPGGRLMIEDFDVGSFGPAFDTPASERVRRATNDFLSSTGYDHYTGRRLPTWFRQAGLENVESEGVVLTLRGIGSTLTQMYRGTFLQLKPALLAGGLISEEDADALLADYDNPEYDGLAHTMMTTWGQRPE